ALSASSADSFQLSRSIRMASNSSAATRHTSAFSCSKRLIVCRWDFVTLSHSTERNDLSASGYVARISSDVIWSIIGLFLSFPLRRCILSVHRQVVFRKLIRVRGVPETCDHLIRE